MIAEINWKFRLSILLTTQVHDNIKNLWAYWAIIDLERNLLIVSPCNKQISSLSQTVSMLIAV